MGTHVMPLVNSRGGWGAGGLISMGVDLIIVWETTLIDSSGNAVRSLWRRGYGYVRVPFRGYFGH